MILNCIPQKTIIINESQIKYLTESLSSILYHFTNIDNLYHILSTNTCILTPSFNSVSDEKLNRGRKYYMSFTRNFSSNSGYVNNQDMTKNVRITFTGDLLNQNYYGFAVDYLYNCNNNNVLQKLGIKKCDKDFGKKVREKSETEDRLVCNKPFIKNAVKYIIRIDILFTGENTNSIKQVISYAQSYHIPINICKTEKEFNNIHFNTQINFTHNNNNNNNNSGIGQLAASKTKFIAQALGLIIFGNKDVSEYNQKAKELFEKYHLDNVNKYAEEIRNSGYDKNKDTRNEIPYYEKQGSFKSDKVDFSIVMQYFTSIKRDFLKAKDKKTFYKIMHRDFNRQRSDFFGKNMVLYSIVMKMLQDETSNTLSDFLKDKKDEINNNEKILKHKMFTPIRIMDKNDPEKDQLIKTDVYATENYIIQRYFPRDKNGNLLNKGLGWQSIMQNDEIGKRLWRLLHLPKNLNFCKQILIDLQHRINYKKS